MAPLHTRYEQGCGQNALAPETPFVAKGSDRSRVHVRCRCMNNDAFRSAGELIAGDAGMISGRKIGLLVVALGCVLAVVSPRRRKALARKIEDARRFASRRIVDRDARGRSRALDVWEGEGGAMA